MYLLLNVPAHNERSPRYMEKALAAIHQSGIGHEAITLIYGEVNGQIALLLRCSEAQQELVLGPLEANYPDCSVNVWENEFVAPTDWVTWSMDLDLVPELYPILRHTQFEDLLSRQLADPISNLLLAVRPEPQIQVRVEITVRPATHARCHAAAEAVRRLDREFFRHRHWCARCFARYYCRGRLFGFAWWLGRLALLTKPNEHRTLETTTSRIHEREEDLQAAADKVGSHLFETHLRLIITAPRSELAHIRTRFHNLSGAFGAITRSRLAHFQVSKLRRGISQPRSCTFLCSHEELATLFHPPVRTSGAEKLKTTTFTELEPPAIFPSLEQEGTCESQLPPSLELGQVAFFASLTTVEV